MKHTETKNLHQGSWSRIFVLPLYWWKFRLKFRWKIPASAFDFNQHQNLAVWCWSRIPLLQYISLQETQPFLTNRATRLEVSQGHQTIRYVMYGFLLVCYSNFVPKTHRFGDIRLVIIQWPWNPGYGSRKVIETDTDRSATYDFLLTFHSNHGPISYRFLDKRQCQSKFANFSHPRRI